MWTTRNTKNDKCSVPGGECTVSKQMSLRTCTYISIHDRHREDEIVRFVS